MPRFGSHLLSRAGSVRRVRPPADLARAAAAIELADLFAARVNSDTLAAALALDEATAARLLAAPRVCARLSRRLALAAESTSHPVDLSGKAIAVHASADRDWQVALLPAERIDRRIRLAGIGWQAPDIRRIVSTAALRQLATAAGDRALEFAERFGPGPAATLAAAGARDSEESQQRSGPERVAAVLARAEGLGRACANAWLAALPPTLALRLRLIWPKVDASTSRIPADSDDAARSTAAQLFRDADRWLVALGDAA